MFTMLNSDVGAEVIARRERAEKRVRGDREDVKKRLFDLFHEKKYWKTKNLAEETDQPDQFVNEILSEIAIKVESGPHRKCWMLKPEYGGGESSDEDEDSLQKKRRF
jgi:transcription initiation factor TFIIF subunit beta